MMESLSTAATQYFEEKANLVKNAVELMKRKYTEDWSWDADKQVFVCNAPDSDLTRTVQEAIEAYDAMTYGEENREAVEEMIRSLAS